MRTPDEDTWEAEYTPLREYSHPNDEGWEGAYWDEFIKQFGTWAYIMARYIEQTEVRKNADSQ